MGRGQDLHALAHTEAELQIPRTIGCRGHFPCLWLEAAQHLNSQSAWIALMDQLCGHNRGIWADPLAMDTTYQWPWSHLKPFLTNEPFLRSPIHPRGISLHCHFDIFSGHCHSFIFSL